MRLIYKDEHEGVWFSKNGHLAYMRGEKPGFLYHGEKNLQPVCVHHIARPWPNGRGYSRELVMFYRVEDKSC
jgi:hypothetical protein